MDPYNVIFLVFVIMALAVRLAAHPADRERANLLLTAMVGSLLLGSLALVLANSLTYIRPLKHDLQVYRIDGLLGLEPSFVLGRYALLHRPLAMVMQLAYILEPSAIAIVFAAYLWLAKRDEQIDVVKTFAINLCMAPVFYLMYPVAGPRFAFPHFPFSSDSAAGGLLAIHAAPNGVPSVHFSFAVLMLWLCWRWVPGRIVAAIYLALIFGATLSSGQHYLFDLILAVPYAAGVRWMAVRPVPMHAELITLPAPELEEQSAAA